MFENNVTPEVAAAEAGGSDGSEVSNTRSIVLVCLAVFGLMTGQQMVNPILAPLARQLGLSELALGVVLAVGASGVVFASSFWGRRARSWGHRPVLLISVVGAALALTAFATIAQIGLSQRMPAWLLLALVIMSRGLLFGLAWAATPVTVQSYIAEATTGEEERVRGMSTFGAAQGLGLAIGPAAGGLLSLGGILLPMYVAPALLLVVAVVLARSIPQSRKRRASRPGTRVGFTDRRVWPFLVVGFGLYSAITLVLVTLGFTLQDRLHLASAQIGLATGSITLAGAAFIFLVQALVVGRLGWAPQRLIRVGSVVMVMGMATVVVAPTFLTLAVGVALLGAGLGFGMPGVAAAPSLLVAREEQESVAGRLNATIAVTFVIAPVLGGGLYGVGPVVPYIVGLALVAIVCAFALGYPGIGRRQSPASFRS